ncbi:MAG: type II toxin-antitoxin system VapC family toxin [Actinomycetota bacterium]
MATLLLDTHSYVWALTHPDRLGDAARDAVSDASNRILVSAASVWEMAIKHRSGKWPEVERLLADHESLVDRLGGVGLDITWRHARRAGALTWDHTDPFDRMLAAQALTDDVELVTRDSAFAEVHGLRLVW